MGLESWLTSIIPFVPKNGKPCFPRILASHLQQQQKKKMLHRQFKSVQQEEEEEDDEENEEAKEEREDTKMGRISSYLQDQITRDKISSSFSNDLAYVASLLRSCGSLHHSYLLHSHIIISDFKMTVFLQNLILQMYGRCGSVTEAQSWFYSMECHDQFSWNFMLSIHSHNGQWEVSLKLFDQLCVEGMVVDDYIFSTTISACVAKEAFEHGKRLHACVVGFTMESIEVVQNALVNFYGKCGCIHDEDDHDNDDLWRMFDMVSERSVVAWSAIILAYSKRGLGKIAIGYWNQMMQEGVTPGRATILAILNACSDQLSLSFAKQVHASLRGCIFESDVKVKAALIHRYGKCGRISDALKIFEDLAELNVVLWTSIIAAYAQHGNSEEALRLFYQMQREGVSPNPITFVSIVEAYSKKGLLDKAKQMHACIKHSGYDSDIIVATAIVNMYGTCGSPKDARKMFDEMPNRNFVSWNAMISVYAQHGLGKNAFELFILMLRNKLKPNKVTFVSMLSACASEGALIEGKWMHDQVVKQNDDKDVAVGNAIINMYSKCGKLELAHNIFQRMRNRNVISWSSMIAAFAQHGHGKKVMPMLRQMKDEGVEPSQVTFKVILLAFSHAGLADDAHCCLNSMSKVYGIKPDGEHYGCVVDLMGRLGRLDDMEDLISKMPVQPSPISWLILLGACSSQDDLCRGERAANQVFEMYPEISAPYVILSNMYVSAGRDAAAEILLSRMKCKGLMKSQDVSYIEVDGKVNEFCLEDQSHIYSEDIHLQLEALYMHIQDAGFGYMIEHGLNEESQDYGVCHHTERLAIAFGFMSTRLGASLFIVKSVRMCSHCHNFAKVISKLCHRKIVIKDANQFHHMHNGTCSCADHW